jgi:beta-ureidopropionase / N-carbamoyl-L-amino-acid hydrolase
MALPHTLTLAQLNQASLDDAAALLDGLYEHSPWIARAALTKRPFQTLAALKHAMVQVVSTAPIDTQLALIRAHPELAGKAMVAGQLTPESDNEQQKAGLTLCTAQDLEIIQQLNRDYQTRFGFPFILAVRGPRGTGLSKEDIIATYQRRLIEHPDFELQECLRNIHRIVELRLNDKFGATPHAGHAVWDWQEALAQYSDNSADLTVTYLTDAHRACAQRIRADMLSCGCDEVTIDAVGNVVGRYHGSQPGTLALMTGSHFDTVRNAGKYDGRLGIYVPLACVRALHQQGKRLPFGLEIIGFSEEEGQRFKATFLGSGALTGDFNPEWLTQKDAAGMSMAQAMAHAGLQVADISAIQRDPARYLGFVEVHIEQGPVLNELNLPLGIVTSINAVVRYQVEAIGTASHAGTTPMNRRRDAAAAVAEVITYVEQRANADADSVGTVGMLQVPNGSINVIPGCCNFTLDLRAPQDAQRDRLEADVLAALDTIFQRRGVQYRVTQTMRANAAPSNPAWQTRWEKAVSALGVPLHRMPSGAGHDAMKLHKILPQAMLFVRGQNSGISHNPLESTTSCDMQLAVEAFDALLQQLALEFSSDNAA